MKEPSIIQKAISSRRYKFMLQQLVNRDFKVRYRGSILGVLWSVLNPLLNMIVLSVVFSQVFKAVDNYKMYLLSGILLFNFFSEATSLSLTAVTGNFGLLTKVYFPKYILPVSKVISSSINLGLTFIAFCFLGSFMNVHIWYGYIACIYLFICLFMFTTGISFILSALNVFMRDIQHIYTVILTMWMYATPILYPIDIIPENIRGIFKINPMFIFIDFFRKIALEYVFPPFSSFLNCFIVAVITFGVGAMVFIKNQSKFIYYT